MPAYGPGSLLMRYLPFIAYPMTATLMVSTTTKRPSGQVVTTWAASNDPTQVNMPARKAPLILQRPQGGELVTDVATVNNLEETVALKSYHPEITSEDRLLIDGLEYDIIKVEEDGNQSYSRFRVLRRL